MDYGCGSLNQINPSKQFLPNLLLVRPFVTAIETVTKTLPFGDARVWGLGLSGMVVPSAQVVMLDTGTGSQSSWALAQSPFWFPHITLYLLLRKGLQIKDSAFTASSLPSVGQAGKRGSWEPPGDHSVKRRPDISRALPQAARRRPSRQRIWRRDRTLTVTRVVITELLQHPRALRGQGWQAEAIQSWLRQKKSC